MQLRSKLSTLCFQQPCKFDYLPILSPPEDIEEFIASRKGDSASIIGNYAGMKSKAHMTLRDNLMNKSPCVIEPQLLALEKKLSKMYSIDLEINRFDYFKNNTGKTIYAAFILTPLTNLWLKELKAIINNKKRSFTPHITVTKQITHEFFDMLWPIFADKECARKFRVEKLTILKKDTFDSSSKYKIFKEFNFRKDVFNEELAFKYYRNKYLNECTQKNEQLKLFK